jgi:uncharacterized membrane protein YphA (DoxX/SURF4 family)
MNSLLRFFFKPPQGPASILLIRIAVGLIFLTQGILKYIDPNMGVVRFTRIGFPHAYFTAHFVGTFEVMCGLLVLLGLWTRAAAVPLLIVIMTAIATTKVPELLHANQGFWYMVSDARTDFAMLCSLFFLISAGGGTWSLDGRSALVASRRVPGGGALQPRLGEFGQDASGFRNRARRFCPPNRLARTAAGGGRRSALGGVALAHAMS